MIKKQLVCNYDDFSVNAYMNRIIQTTMGLLVRSDISNIRKKELRKLLIFFGEVDYQILISICYLVIKGLLQNNTDGSTKLMDFLDEQRMCRFYEKFILEYLYKI